MAPLLPPPSLSVHLLMIGGQKQMMEEMMEENSKEMDIVLSMVLSFILFTFYF